MIDCASSVANFRSRKHTSSPGGTGSLWVFLENAASGYPNSAGFDTVGLSSSAPEPAAWAMMLMGFAGLGARLRRRRARLAPTAA